MLGLGLESLLCTMVQGVYVQAESHDYDETHLIGFFLEGVVL